MSKRVALTQRVETIENIGERRDALSQEWAVLAEACGFVPLILPNRLGAVRSMLEEMPPDSIILTGGNDLGEAPERDDAEGVLIQFALENRVPLLGVCRGMQMLLHTFGTPLVRVGGHVRVEHLLSNGDKVNSFHGWGALECRPPLAPLAWSGDGVLESVAHQEYPWVRGIMWHPERYCPLRERDIQWIREALKL